ncbi:MAG: hypothetical protein ACYDAQ_12635 [Mycobacteriales bacterium]
MAESARPAFYAAGPGRLRDWWTLLHPPYTAWHLSYVVIGAALAQRPGVVNLVAAVAAFFFAVGLSAHALDELHGRPLRTHIPAPVLVTTAVVGAAIAVGLGAAGVVRVGVTLIPFIVVGPVLLTGYNLEMFGGRLHGDAWFAASWGAFPVLTGCVAQHGQLTVAAGLSALAAFALSAAQRALSNPARALRRRTKEVTGRVVRLDGSVEPVTAQLVLQPVESALRWSSAAIVLFATAIAVARLG